MTFEEFAATRMPGVLRFAAVLAGDREKPLLNIMLIIGTL